MGSKRVVSVLVLALTGSVGCFGGGGGGGEGEGGSSGSHETAAGAGGDSLGTGGGSASFIPSSGAGGEGGSGGGDQPGGSGGSEVGGAGGMSGASGSPSGGSGGVGGNAGSAGSIAGTGSPDAGGGTSQATYYDDVTDLEWAPQPSEPTDYYTAERYCDELVHDSYDDWRLPSISELRTLSPCYLTEFVGRNEDAIAPCRIHDNCADLAQCFSDVACATGCAGIEFDAALGVDAATGRLWSRTASLGGEEDHYFALGLSDASLGDWYAYDDAAALCVRGSLYAPDFDLPTCGTPCGTCDDGQICAETSSGGICVPADCTLECAGVTCNFNLTYGCEYDSCAM